MSFLLYGAYGYTGSLIAHAAARMDMDFVVAGRDPERTKSLGQQLDRPSRVVSIDNRAALDAVLNEVGCVLNCAGPFIFTAAKMVEACYRTGTDYLDITGEVTVLQNLASQHSRARAAGITLLPAVGFDVVSSDCVAARVSDRLPNAEILEVAIYGKGGFSRGTAKTTIEQARSGGLVRHKGRIKRIPAAWRSREVDFGEGPMTVTSAPLGDLVSAYYSAQIPTILTYIRLPKEAERGLKLSRYATWLLRSDTVTNALKQLVDKQPEGPTPEQRERGSSYAWAQASRADGSTVISRISCPDAYNFTVDSSLHAVRTMEHGSVPHGYQTPATAFGHAFVEKLEGVTVEDVI